MSPILIIYCLLIIAGSMLGGWLPTFVRLTHVRMQLILSFVGGLMLGIGLLHLLPHGIAEAGNVDGPVRWAMVGLLSMFFLIRTFHFHQHGPVDDEETDCQHDGHDHDHEHHGHNHMPVHQLSWMGVMFGLAVHTLIDGAMLATAVVAESGHVASFAGLGVFLAIVLHKPLDALSITTLMRASGRSPGVVQAVNFGFALMCPLGAALMLLVLKPGIVSDQPAFLGNVLGFSAGIFLCISLSDLLPEVQFHRHDRLKLSACLLLGVALAYGIGFLEPSHSHDLPGSHTQHETDQHDHGHDHSH